MIIDMSDNQQSTSCIAGWNLGALRDIDRQTRRTGHDRNIPTVVIPLLGVGRENLWCLRAAQTLSHILGILSQLRRRSTRISQPSITYSNITLYFTVLYSLQGRYRVRSARQSHCWDDPYFLWLCSATIWLDGNLDYPLSTTKLPKYRSWVYEWLCRRGH